MIYLNDLLPLIFPFRTPPPRQSGPVVFTEPDRSYSAWRLQWNSSSVKKTFSAGPAVRFRLLGIPHPYRIYRKSIYCRVIHFNIFWLITCILCLIACFLEISGPFHFSGQIPFCQTAFPQKPKIALPDSFSPQAGYRSAGQRQSGALQNCHIWILFSSKKQCVFPRLTVLCTVFCVFRQ